MILRIILFFCFYVSFAVFSFECSQPQAKKMLIDYQWYTEDFPPYHYQNKQGKLVGIYPEILALIYKELELEINLEAVKTVPWARLLFTLERSIEHAAFSIIQTFDKRSNKFQLITLPVMTNVSIMVLNENKDILAKQKLEDLIYSVVRQDIGEYLLDEIGTIKNKQQTTTAQSMLYMLIHNRVNAIAYSELVANFQMNKLGFTNKKLVPIYTLSDKLKTAFIFHKDTPTCVTDLFSQTISSLDEKGEIARIVKKHQY